MMGDQTLPGIGGIARGKAVGARVTRLEDPRLLVGDARYVADLSRPRMLHAAFVRSPFAHARIVSVNCGEAEALPGCVAVVDGARLTALPLEDASNNPKLPKTPQPALAIDRARWAGEAVAVVVADSAYTAEDAADLVEVEYEELDAVDHIDSALAQGAIAIHEHLPDNVLYRDHFATGDVEGTFRDAAHVFHRQVHTIG